MNAEELRKLNELALSVLKVSRNTLVIHLRFMDSAISRLRWVSIPEMIAGQPDFPHALAGGLMTEGTYIAYDPVAVCRMYAKEKNTMPRAYLHMVLHCVFRHFMVAPVIEHSLWDLACDMAVEGVIAGLELPALDTGHSSSRQAELKKIAPQVNHLLTAEKLYHWLQDTRLDEATLRRLQNLFSVDDHAVWYQPPPSSGGGNGDGKQDQNGNGKDRSGGAPSSGQDRSGDGDQSPGDGRAGLEQDWRDVAQRMQLDMETFSKQQGDRAGSMMQNLRQVNREKYDYTAFLKKFAVMGEAMKINDDEFDYIFYTYGMGLFPQRRMPLIEPLEYKDVKRIREFVIAIDTSGSVQGGLVQKFVQKTYNILKSTESFFSRINIHIIQCDAEIQEDVKITSQEEFDEYLQKMMLKGFGGTDFRPVFERINKMVEDGEFTNLRGLIYFTDGYGVFPERMPAYQTAFVFVDDEDTDVIVPPWAIKVILRSEEI